MTKKKSNDELITEAKLFFETYRKEIGESIRKGKKVVFVNFEDISSNSPMLAEALISNPEEVLEIMEVALEESGLIKSPRLRLNNLPETQKVKIRTIRAHHLNQLIYFEGLVRQASDVRPQVVNAKFECPSCGTVISVLQIEKKFREPSRCSCGRKGQFRLISKIMVDAQRLVIEESPESLSGGEQPRRMAVFLKEDLVEPWMEEKTTPGSKVRVLGILKEVPVPLQTGSISTRFDLAVEANSIIALESTYEELDISEEDERQIQELAADPELFRRLRDSVAPSIWGYEEIKEALVLQMFGGVRKVSSSDGSVSRGDIHLFLIGDPGVAKSISKDGKIMYFSNDSYGYETIEKIFEIFGESPKDLQVLTIDQISQKSKWAYVDKIIKHLPEKNLIKVTTEHGKSITATLDHSFITMNKDGAIIPIKGGSLKKDDFLPIPIDFHKELITYIILENKNSSQKLLQEKVILDKNFGFLIGIFLAEGYIRGNRTVIISNKDSNIKARIFESVSSLGIIPQIKTDCIEIYSRTLADYLKKNCYINAEKIKNKVKGNFSRIKKIPDFCYFSPKGFCYGLISGIFSGDGRLIKDKKMLKGFELISVSKELAFGVSDILFSLGIINKIKQNSYTYKDVMTSFYSVSVPTYRIKNFSNNIEFLGREFNMNKNDPIYSYNNLVPCTDLVYCMTKDLGFNSRKIGDRTFSSMMRTVKKRGSIGRLRLQKILKRFIEISKNKSSYDNKTLEQLKLICDSNIIWSRITKIEHINKSNEDVYDLSVPLTNTFVANGIGVHNSVTLKFISDLAPKGRYIVGKAASLDYEEPLLIQENGIIKFKKIGEFVDKFYSKDQDGFVACKEDINALSLDLGSLKLKWKPIRAVYRHKCKDKLLEFLFETGRKIRITKDHSIFCIENSEIKCKNSSELKIGDYVMIPKYIPNIEKEIPLGIARFLGYFIAEGHLYNKDGSYKVEFTLNKNEKEIIDDISEISKEILLKETKIAPHGDNGVRLTIYGKSSYDQVCGYLDELAHKKAKEKGVPEIILNSNEPIRKAFFDSYMKGDFGVTKSKRLMSEILYLKLFDKEIASCVERSDDKITFLKDRKIIGTGNRYDLICPIPVKRFNNSRVNFPLKCISKEIYKFFKRKSDQGYNRINLESLEKNIYIKRILKLYEKKQLSIKEIQEIYGKNSNDFFSEHKEYFTKTKINNKTVFTLTEKGSVIGKEIHNIKKILNGDVTFVKIKKISEIKNNNKFVYDVSTPEDENFIAGFGGIVCHNTGAGITATVVKDEFLKGWALEAGAMVLANKGIVCIDEIEKMDANDRSAMHEALEQQCYHHDTIITLSDGRERKIGELVEEIMKNNKDKIINGKDCLILPTNDLEVLTTDFKKIYNTKINRVSKHKSYDHFIKIKFSHGREIIVTPEHPVFIVKNGEIVTKRADSVVLGESVPIPLFLPIEGKKQYFSGIETNFRANRHIIIPQSNCEEIFKIAGYFISEGSREINRKKIIGINITNKDKRVLDDFEYCMRKVFNLEPYKQCRIDEHEPRFMYRYISTELKDFLLKNMPEMMKTSGEKEIPQVLLKGQLNNIAKMLSSMFEGDGHVSIKKRTIRVGYSTKSKRLAEQVQDLLLRFKIRSNLNKDRDYYKVLITGYENLQNFALKIGFFTIEKNIIIKRYLDEKKIKRTVKDIIPQEYNEKIINIIENENIEKVGNYNKYDIIYDHLKRKDRFSFSRNFLINLKSLIKDPKNLEFLNSLTQDIGFEKISGIEIIKNEFEDWVYDITIEPNHSFVSQAAILHNTVTISKANVQACYSKDTEVLTEQGWKKYQDVKNLKIAQFDPKTKEIFFLDHLGLYEYDYNGIMHNFINKRNDILVTPNHKMLLREERNKNYEVIEAEKIKYNRIRVLNSGNLVNDPSKYLILPAIKHLQNRKHEKYTHMHQPKKIPMELFLEFLGYYLTEGGLETNPTIGIVQKKGKNSEKIEKCLKKFSKNINSTLTKIDCGPYVRYKITSTQLYTYLEDYRKKCYQKKFLLNEIPLSKLSKDQLIILFKALMLGDGSSDNKSFYSTSTELIDFFQAISCLIGKSASKHLSYFGKDKGNRKDMYRICLSNRTEPIIRKEKAHFKKFKYNGKVFCFSTKTGFFITRRNGKIAIQGNTLSAQTSVLAAGNPKYGRFEPTQSINQQIDLPPALINRFDLIFVVRDLPNAKQDEAIASHVLKMHQHKGKKSDIDRDLFRKYVAYAKRKCEPQLTDDAVGEIRDFYVKMRNMQASGDGNSVAISARQLQGLVRLSESHAKSRMSPIVEKKDVDVAIRLTNYYLMQVGYDPETKKFDIDRFTTKVSSSQRNKILLLKDTIKKLEERFGKQVPLEELRQELLNSFSDNEFEEGLERLKKTGDIFQPKSGFIQDVGSR